MVINNFTIFVCTADISLSCTAHTVQDISQHSTADLN